MALKAIYKTQDVVPSSGPLNELETYVRLTDIFRTAFHEDVLLTPRTTAEDVEGWDSFAHVHLVLAIESEFRIRFSSSEMERMHSVGDMATIILRRSSDSQ